MRWGSKPASALPYSYDISFQSARSLHARFGRIVTSGLALRPLALQVNHARDGMTCAPDHRPQLRREGTRLRCEPSTDERVDRDDQRLGARPVDRTVERRWCARVQCHRNVWRAVEITEIDAREGV